MQDPRGRPAVRFTHDLLMGARFAVIGGRHGWLRTVLTALGVGLGVAVLLLAAAIPSALTAAKHREAARTTVSVEEGHGPTDRTLLIASVNSGYRDMAVNGLAVQAEGPHAPVPPGLSRLPGPGELAVSPALAELLASPDGALLKERFPQLRITAHIGDEGLINPGELLYYQGTDALRAPDDGVDRITEFGTVGNPVEPEPLVVLAIIVGCAALLVPVTVFVATAIRLGGERRDLRLAALRLVGADRATTRRIAAGEALAGSLLGLLTGTALFLAVRIPLSSLTLFGLGAFPSDVVPDPVLTSVIALGLPVCAVGVALFTMRRVTVEPLGVTRKAPPLRRRLWWRPLLPAAGVALLLPQVIGGVRSGDAASAQVIVGVSLLLLGVAAFLPWLLDAVVAWLCRGGLGRRGGQSWHLAVRRLQLTSGTASRSISGITVAVAGAIAAQVLLSGALPGLTDMPRGSSRWVVAGAREDTAPAARAHRLDARLGTAEGVRASHGLITGYADSAAHQRAMAHGSGHEDDDPEPYPVTVADCATLRALTRITACSDGDVFLAEDPDDAFRLPRPGERLALSPLGSEEAGHKPATWTVPATARHTAPARELPPRVDATGLLATPRALDATHLHDATVNVMLRLDPDRPDALDHVRNIAAQVDIRAELYTYDAADTDDALGTVRRALAAGAVAVLVLIGAGLLITTLEQLHERARLLSALDALGTPRTVLGLSVLWYTTIPVVLGLTLAVACGLGLGTLLLHMVDRPPMPDWPTILTLTGTAAVVIVGVTVMSLPLLWRLMRPEGLRTE
ncbi:FtsX-like permease family protein [Streptomyces halobius]|uniref:ABC transporter permease n=1 Tax=Streptomyces halobius TaxID=2879846 RepID=A0ABY4MAA5_9ACTN|nr:FtsX-like permease family protein [Streptomyces halobius]UQA93340.1 ABC transporter permease [Streptomyces halobius]